MVNKTTGQVVVKKVKETGKNVTANVSKKAPVKNITGGPFKMKK